MIGGVLAGGLLGEIAGPRGAMPVGALGTLSAVLWLVFSPIGGLQEDHVGVAADLETVAVEIEDFCGFRGDGGKTLPHGVAAGHLRDVKAHRGDLQHVGLAERVPGVHDAVVAEGAGDVVI